MPWFPNPHYPILAGLYLEGELIPEVVVVDHLAYAARIGPAQDGANLAQERARLGLIGGVWLSWHQNGRSSSPPVTEAGDNGAGLSAGAGFGSGV